MCKRVFDFLLALIGLLIIWPVLAVIAICIKTESPGPVFYRGLRVGLHGNTFKIFKFRSMVIDADKIGPSSTSDEDPRITKTGKFVRKYKLDELPQLLNVLKGDMSFVGPRPQDVEYMKQHYSAEDMNIFDVRPGITDWASLKFHNEGEIILASGIADADEAYTKLIHPEKLQLQLKYVKEHNIWIDLKILWQTFTTLVYTRAR